MRAPNWAYVYNAILVGIYLIIFITWDPSTHLREPSQYALNQLQVLSSTTHQWGSGLLEQLAPVLKGKTLVFYVYHQSEKYPETYAANFEFFITVGIGKEANPLVDYVVIINGETTMTKMEILDNIPPNVRVIRRENACVDGGSVGAVLDTIQDAWSYAYYMIINSSVRGPYLPRYFPRGKTPWTTAFTDLIEGDVKLVGTTINCEKRAHVQSMVLAMDRIGFETIKAAGALDCASTKAEAIEWYELGSTKAILEAGYSVDSLMIRYKGIHWSNRTATDLACNQRRNPTMQGQNDGMNLSPFEVLFMKAQRWTPEMHSLQKYMDYYTGKGNIQLHGEEPVSS